MAREIALDVDVAEPAIEMGAALVGGGLQRVAWEVSTPMGFIATTVMGVGGLVGSFMMDGIGRALARGVAAAGMAIAGWVATERFMLPSAHAEERTLTPEQRQAALAAARERRALGEGTRTRSYERERAEATLAF